MLYIGADHRGFALKEQLKSRLQALGIELIDLGDDHLDPQDDYVIFSQKVADEVRKNPENRGIVICGSGAGVDMVANKVDGIRCALAFDEARAIQARQHEDVNMLALPSDALDEETAFKMVQAFLNTQFSGEERHVRRLSELKEVEENHQ